MQASRIRIVLAAAGLLAAAPLFANECDGTNALSDSHLAAGAGGAADVDGAGTSAGEGPAGAGTSTGEAAGGDKPATQSGAPSAGAGGANPSAGASGQSDATAGAVGVDTGTSMRGASIDESTGPTSGATEQRRRDVPSSETMPGATPGSTPDSSNPGGSTR